MQEQALFASKPETLNVGVSSSSCHCAPCHPKKPTNNGFRGPFSIRAILSSRSSTVGTLEHKDQHQFSATNHGHHSLSRNWEVSHNTSPSRYYTHKTTARWPRQHQHRGSREISVEKCAPAKRQAFPMKRSRTVYSPKQLQRLEQEFNGHQYIAGKQRGRLAAALNLTDTQIKVWFQNRRIRYRKQNHKSCQTVHSTFDTPSTVTGSSNYLQLNNLIQAQSQVPANCSTQLI